MIKAISLLSLLLMGDVLAANRQGLAFIKDRPQQQEDLKEQEQAPETTRMTNSEKKAWNMGWEKDQRPYVPIKTKPDRSKRLPSEQ
jgi:predicted DNA-binding protein (MmcQ/YjbR family)